MRALLVGRLQATRVELRDTSGGCGEFFALEVESPLFVGRPTLAQHRLVNECLAAHIGAMHGLTLKTRASPSPSSAPAPAAASSSSAAATVTTTAATTTTTTLR